MQLNWHQISLVVAQNSNEVAIVSLEAYAEKYKKGEEREREQASLRLSHVKFMRLVRIAKEDMHDK